jgi:hypothetical protein
MAADSKHPPPTTTSHPRQDAWGVTTDHHRDRPHPTAQYGRPTADARTSEHPHDDT